MLILLRTRYLSTYSVQGTSKFSEWFSKFHTFALFIIAELQIITKYKYVVVL